MGDRPRIRSWWPWVLGGSLCLGVVTCGGGGGTAPPVGPNPPPVLGPVVQVWASSADQSQKLARLTDLRFSSAQAASATVIEVDTAQRFQEMVGFGAALTDASAYLIQQKLTPEQRTALLEDLFGRSSGIGLNFVRLPVGASDFSRTHYTLDDVPAGQTDFTLQQFSTAPWRTDVLPTLKGVQAVQPQLRLMATPWSAPAWMKTNGSLVASQGSGVRGSLRSDSYAAYAQYLLRVADALEAEGLPLFALSVQNEPDYEPADYPGMRLDAAERIVLLGQHVGPLFAARAQKVKLLDWDHNWDNAQSPLSVLADAQARAAVSGVAWHCYGGEVSAQSTVHDAYPDKETYFTECSGGDWSTDWGTNLLWNVRQLVIGATRHWAKGVMLWNLALDENHGPHLGGCSNCRGVVTVHSSTGAVTRNPEYYALAHASRFVRPGAHRVASTSGSGGVDSVAFRNADDGSVVVILANSNASARQISVRQGTQTVEVSLPGSTVATLVW